MDDVLRIGKISSINYEKGTARVTYPDRGGSTTPEIPFPSWFYWMPKPEDQVLVAHLQNGPASAVILCPFWNDSLRPTEGFEGLYKQEYAREQGKAGERYDATTEDYNQSITGTALVSATETWTAQAGEASAAIQLSKDGTITINAKRLVLRVPDLEIIEGINLQSAKAMSIDAAESLTVTSPDSKFKGPVKVEGAQEVTQTLKVGSSASVTGDISTQANLSAQGNATIQGDATVQGGVTAQGDVAAQGDVTAKGISLKHHRHEGGGGEPVGSK